MGKGGQKSVGPAAAEKGALIDNEVLIDGRFYDVTNLKHPGGSVIKYYAGKGIDASQAFTSFHVRSKKAKKMMEHLPSRAATEKEMTMNRMDGQISLLEDFNQLSRELEAEGFYKPHMPHVIMRLLEIIVMHAVGFYLLFNGSVLGGLVLLGIVSGRCGWLMHEGGHYSLTGNIGIDRTMQIVLYGVGCGMSGSWWRNQHNKHHSMPQKLGHDVDLNTLPLVAFTEKVVRRAGFPMKLWLRMQAVMFPVLTTLLVALGWQFFLHPKHIVRTKNWAEGLSLVARYVLWTYFITGQFGLVHSTLIYVAYNWVAANYIFINFAVSHTHLPTVAKEDKEVDWVRYAAIHTMNVSPGPLRFVDWWMSYLNYQIEHHLFPSMPQFRFPLISARVRALLEKHGLKYDQRNYIEAMKVTFANLDHVGAEVFYG